VPDLPGCVATGRLSTALYDALSEQSSFTSMGLHRDSLVSPVAQPFRAATRAGGAGLKGLRYKGAR
jgi:hypothetical protein